MGVLNIAVFLVAGPLVGLFHLSAAAAADARAVLYTFTVASILICRSPSPYRMRCAPQAMLGSP